MSGWISPSACMLSLTVWIWRCRARLSGSDRAVMRGWSELGWGSALWKYVWVLGTLESRDCLILSGTPVPLVKMIKSRSSSSRDILIWPRPQPDGKFLLRSTPRQSPDSLTQNSSQTVLCSSVRLFMAEKGRAFFLTNLKKLYWKKKAPKGLKRQFGQFSQAVWKIRLRCQFS